MTDAPVRSAEAAPPDPRPAGVSALRSGRAHLRLWLLAVVGLAVDLASKNWAFDNLKVGEVRSFIPFVLEFRLSLNPGALFGLGSGLVPVFIIASIAALGFVIYLFAGTRREQWILHAALSLIFAGAMGNLYDRALMQRDLIRIKGESGKTYDLIGTIQSGRGGNVIHFKHWLDPDHAKQIEAGDLAAEPQRVGVVRDFLKIHFGNREIWPWVFNLADVFLVVGVGVLLLSYCVRAPARAAAPDGAMSRAPAPAEL